MKVVRVASDEVIKKGLYITGGDVVEISGVVEGDVYTGGSQVSVDGVIEGDLIAGGGTINISGTVVGDVRIAGGQVNISGEVGNLTMFAGYAEITDSAKVNGYILSGAGNLTIAAPVDGDVRVGAGNLVISNKVDGDVDASVETLRLTSEAEIAGNLSYVSDLEAVIDQKATVSGKIKRTPIPQPIKDKDLAPLKKGLGKAGSSIRMIGFLMALAFGLFMLRFFPNYVNSVAATLKNELWQSLLAGFLTLFIAPLVMFVLVFTVVGIPFSLFGFFLYVVYIYLAKIFVAICIGDFLYERIGREKTKYLPFVLGLIVFYVLSIIPYIGGLTGFAVLLFGLGAAVLNFKKLYPKALRAKIY